MEAKAIEILKSQIEYLRWLANKDTDEEDMETAYQRACGYVHGFDELGLLGYGETLEWVLKFADACEGR